MEQKKTLTILKFATLIFLILAVFSPILTLVKLETIRERLASVEQLDRQLMDLGAQSQILYARQYYIESSDEYIVNVSKLIKTYEVLEVTFSRSKMPTHLSSFWNYTENLLLETVEYLEMIQYEELSFISIPLIEQIYLYRDSYNYDRISVDQYVILSSLIENLVFFSTEVVPQGSLLTSKLQSEIDQNRLDALQSFSIPGYLLILAILFFVIQRIMHRIQKHRDAEEAVIAENRILEELVHERTSELEEQNRLLKETREQMVERGKMAALGQLVAGVAHEINTPMGIAVTAVSFVNDLLTSESEEEIERDVLRDASGLALSNLNRASGLLQAFKRIAIDESLTGFRNFDLMSYLLSDLAPSLTHQLKNRGHNLNINGPEILNLWENPRDIAQVLTNLVDNASLHGYEKLDSGTIQVTVAKKTEMVSIVVSDDGRGMNKETRDRLFEPFFTSARSRGRGLGMTLVYNVVNGRMGGQVLCETKPGKGTTVEILIPWKLSETENGD